MGALPAAARPPARLRSVDAVAAAHASVRVHLVIPRSFNDAQQVADKFKDNVPVILNLQGTENDLSKRLIDFASGLTYALDGGMQRIADKVFMLTPRNVEISAEERARLTPQAVPTEYAPGGTGQVAGTSTDEVDGAPVQRVEVAWSDGSTSTLTVVGEQGARVCGTAAP